MTTNIWIRPGADVPWGAASYGTGDGSSYTNAFAGLQDPGIDWGILDLQVWICGVHAPLEDAFTNTARFRVNAAMGGTARQPTIIRMDDPNEAGRIWGGQFYPLASWTVYDAPSNTYQITLPRADEPTLYQITNRWIYDLGADTLGTDRLVKRASIADVQANPGSYYATGTVGGSTVYVRLSDDADPSADHRVLFPSSGYRFNQSSIPNTIFHKSSVFPTDVIQLDSDNVQLRRTTVWFGRRNDSETGGIFIGNARAKIDGFVAYRCDIGHCFEGAIYSTVDPSNVLNPNRWAVTHNYIHDVGDPAWHDAANTDNHGVGVQNGEGWHVYGNVVENTGPAIIGYFTQADQDFQIMRNHSIRRNVVRSPRNQSSNLGQPCYEWDMQDGEGDASGNVIAYNVARDLAAGGSDPTSAPGCGFKFADTNPDNVPTFTHNVAENVPDSIYSNVAGQYMTVTNFTSLAPTAKHVRMRSATANATFNNNDYSGGPGGDEFKNGVTDYTWAEWQAAGYDPESTHS